MVLRRRKYTVRKEELRRLCRYAEGLGTRVRFAPRKKGHNAYAEWELFTDNTTLITIYTYPGVSRLSLVLSLIHELGHHRDFIAGNRRDTGEPSGDEVNLTREQRKQIYDYELRGMKYWKQIYHDTDCRFPIWRLFMQMEIDIEAYHYYCIHGKNRTKKIQQQSIREIRERHRQGFEAEPDDLDDLLTIWNEDRDEDERDGEADDGRTGGATTQEIAGESRPSSSGNPGSEAISLPSQRGG